MVVDDERLQRVAPLQRIGLRKVTSGDKTYWVALDGSLCETETGARLKSAQWIIDGNANPGPVDIHFTNCEMALHYPTMKSILRFETVVVVDDLVRADAAERMQEAVLKTALDTVAVVINLPEELAKIKPASTGRKVNLEGEEHE